MNDPTKAGSARPRRLKWHHIYYMLAAFDVATVSFSLFLNHQILQIYTQSVAANQEWAERIGGYADLAQAAAAVNAPGNDVFATQDAALESEKMEGALSRFDRALHAARSDLMINVGGSTGDSLDEDLDRVDAAMRAMVAESRLIFTHFEEDDPAAAGRQMAEMDRKYGQVRTALDDLEREVREIQEDNFDRQTGAAAALARYEYIIGGFIFLMVAAITLYGHKLSRKMQSDQTERERFLKELQEAESRTRAIVLERTQGLKEALAKQSELAKKNAQAYEVIRCTQEQLVTQERLAAVGEVAAAVAHGIRNPLASIRAAADVAREELPEDSMLNETLDDIIAEVSRLDHRIRAVLDLARPFAPSRAMGDLNEFLGEFADGIRKRLPDTVSLDIEPDPELPAMLFDRAHMHEVLDAIVTNAVEAIGKKGKVTIRSSLHQDGEAGPWVLLSVADTGSGIEPSRIGRIFDLFYSNKPSGTGIGLPMAKRLVESSGGKIEVTSRPGQPTTFTLRLPIEQEP